MCDASDFAVGAVLGLRIDGKFNQLKKHSIEEDESMKSCCGGMMVKFGLFDGLEMEAFGEAMEIDN
ncbi:hypothetical protein Tco_0147393, partial [Tanacetum coccineum]